MKLSWSIRHALSLAAFGLIAMLAVSGGGATWAAAADGTAVAITITDSVINAPKTLPAGFTTINVTNAGTMPHDASFFRLNPGATLEQLLAASGNADDPAAFLGLQRFGAFYGGPNSIDPGATVPIILNLTAATYGIADPQFFDQIPPVTITVTGTAGSAAPSADVMIRQREFAFDVPATVKAGSTRIEVHNAGSQVHEMVLAKLDPGYTLDEVKAAASQANGDNNQAPPDWVHPTISWDPQSTTVTGQFTVDLTPGTYAVLCFLPDTATGTPHAVLGMVNTFTVQ